MGKCLGIRQESLLPPAYFKAFIPIKKIKYDERSHINYIAPLLFIPCCVSAVTQLILLSVDINCHFLTVSLTCSSPFISWFICHYHSHMQTSTAITSILIKKKRKNKQTWGPVSCPFHQSHASISVDFYSLFTSAKGNQEVSPCPVPGIPSSHWGMKVNSSQMLILISDIIK